MNHKMNLSPSIIQEIEITKISDKISSSLKGKSLEDLLLIYYNIEEYTFAFLSKEKKENEELLLEVSRYFQQIKQFQSSDYNEQIEKCSNELLHKEESLKKLIHAIQESGKRLEKEEVIKSLRAEIELKFNEPKKKLMNDLITNKITFEEYKAQFKDIGMKYYYYTIIVDKLSNII